MTRHLTRPLFAAWFVVEGVDALRHPAGHAAVLRAAAQSLSRRVPQQQALRDAAQLDARTLHWAVRAHGAATVTAAACLAAGRAPRTAAAALALLTAPVALSHLARPTGVETPAQRALRRERLVRSTSFAAGAALAATGAAPRRPCPAPTADDV